MNPKRLLGIGILAYILGYWLNFVLVVFMIKLIGFLSALTLGSIAVFLFSLILVVIILNTIRKKLIRDE
jgi:hypothetical protein